MNKILKIIHKKTITFVFLFLICLSVFSQSGGNSVYRFLELTNSARVAALGGNLLAINDNDVNLSFHNPALLNSRMDNHFVFNYTNYFADINYGYVSYAKAIPGIGNFGVGMQYINYGDFIFADEIGNKTGKFTASEKALNIIYSKAIDSSITIGINLKPVSSELGPYKSWGLAADAGVNYNSDDGLFSGALVVKNLGFQVKKYRDNNNEPLPFQIQAGISQKLEHAPFRLSLVAEHLEKYDLTYLEPNLETNQLFDSNSEPKPNPVKEHADKIMRHIIVGVEIIPMPNLFLNLGYNYRRRQELKIDSRSYTVGLSWGFGIKISKFRLSYGRGTYHLAGATNHFTLSANFSEFYRKG